MKKIKLSVTFIKKDTDNNIDIDLEFDDKKKMAQYIMSLKGQGVFLFGIEFLDGKTRLFKNETIITESAIFLEKLTLLDLLLPEPGRKFIYYLYIVETYKEAYSLAYDFKEGSPRRDWDSFLQFLGKN